jgi:ABC-type lipoprotein export system ATPase subunit/predicted nuclease with TOPRIM domain
MSETSSPTEEGTSTFRGSTFLRADLHVHTHPDSDTSPAPDLDPYIDAAIASGIDVLAITDHNTVQFTRPAMAAADKKQLLVLPGIEVSTHDGHLLALFDPADIAVLEGFANPTNLRLGDLRDGEQRSSRSILDLVQEIDRLGGLAIPAHVDVGKGMGTSLKPAELIELLTNPALAGLEFGSKEALETWFTPQDDDEPRKAAWHARQKVPEPRERGLARLMSSDAHSPDKVGRDRASRTLTRLRLDDPNFAAVRNAIALNPKARCKAEVELPSVYPRIVSAKFEGGFLDGVSLNFSDNLTCLIGGRGSGKSTALLAIRAALGAATGSDEDPDDADRMPDVTTVRFIDSTGSERTAIRRRGQLPEDAAAGSAIRLRLADLGQDESGRLARGYNDNPELLIEFLDTFLVRHVFDEAEADGLARLEDNASEVKRTFGAEKQIKELEREHGRLEAQLKAATVSKVELIAKWATLLAAQGPMLETLEEQLNEAVQPDIGPIPDLEGLASAFDVDLAARPAVDFVNGDDGLRQALAKFGAGRKVIQTKATTELKDAARPVRERLDAWKADQVDLAKRLQAKRAELEAQGLKVQAGAVEEIARRLKAVNVKLRELRQKRQEHTEALKARAKLLNALYTNRDNLYSLREQTVRQIADKANTYSDELAIRVFYRKAAVNSEWIDWLKRTFDFRRPRVEQLAGQISPGEFADAILHRRHERLLDLKDQSDNPFFTADTLQRGWQWDQLFELETMRLEDSPRIEIQRKGSSDRQSFDHLSAGQQRSVLLSLLLCAERSEPLVLDQPEDHLDGKYIAEAVVQHLEAAKERRQVIIATHSANLTVLGDAELVVPMKVKDGHGAPYELGAVDRPATRDEVCALLEGGVEAYKKRGQRYGFRFASVPSPSEATDSSND